MSKQRPPKSFRLSLRAEELIDKLSEKLGVQQSTVMEIAIRKMAEGEGMRASAVVMKEDVNYSDIPGTSQSEKFARFSLANYSDRDLITEEPVLITSNILAGTHQRGDGKMIEHRVRNEFNCRRRGDQFIISFGDGEDFYIPVREVEEMAALGSSPK